MARPTDARSTCNSPRPQHTHTPCVLQAPPRMSKDNMSKEMKDRLRKEYVGFGGAESKVGQWCGVEGGAGPGMARHCVGMVLHQRSANRAC